MFLLCCYWIGKRAPEVFMSIKYSFKEKDIHSITQEKLYVHLKCMTVHSCIRCHHFLPCLLRQGLSLNLKITVYSVRMVDSQSQRSFIFCPRFQHWGYRHSWPHWPVDLKLCLHAYLTKAYYWTISPDLYIKIYVGRPVPSSHSSFTWLRREAIPTSYPLTSMCTLWHVHACILCTLLNVI